jgi:Ca2+-binding RTX toxin-like protein
MLYGSTGNDTYVFNRGDGHDTIFDEGSYGHDKIVFGEGIFKDDLIVHLDDASNLIVGLKEEGVDFEDLENKITIKNYTSSQNRIEAFVFSDGSSIIGEEIFEYIGNIIYGTSGDDILYGGEGNDVFYADDGNDTLYGGLGNDTYVFNRGDGQDTIIDEGSYSFYGDAGEGGHDKIVFGEGISINDIEVIKTDDDDLQIIIGNHQTEVASAIAMSTYAVAAQDSILIKRWYTEYAIETM